MAASAASAAPMLQATAHRTAGSFITDGSTSAPQTHVPAAKATTVTAVATTHLPNRSNFYPSVQPANVPAQDGMNRPLV